MKKAFQIFRRDIKRLFHNRAALLIVVGLSHQKQPYPMAGIHALHGIAAIFLRTSVGPMA
ncbi:hypothetical protein FYJ25_10075 [Anaerobutyricum soehngenii]|uniref:Uncharacterized protein n=1 Tax=Anaerobutyricum soehngenii TaxID=105843 RepID=A0A6N7YCB5_9FIRM|nr:hypothetical protein [Anaerobutyricum soehngenii]MSU82677.1 hypothetical protein [Anaerobutyricum soehngenii]